MPWHAPEPAEAEESKAEEAAAGEPLGNVAPPISGDLTPPLQEREHGTVNGQRIFQTVQAADAPPRPEQSPQPPAGESDGELGPEACPALRSDVPPLPVDPHRDAATIDFAGVTPAVDKQFSKLRGGKYDATATPRTSLGKAGAPVVEALASRAIHLRTLREAATSGATPEIEPDYTFLRRLAEGGMGIVLAARQTSIDRTVAVKKIKPDQLQSPDSQWRFLSEAVVTGHLEHPNIVPIYDLGKDETGLLFYSMKHVVGQPWDRELPQKTLQENLEIFMKIADAVAFAHSRHILHRDIKPQNVMLGGYGEVLLIDWGLAIQVGSESAKATDIVGTLAYMAPEMAATPEKVGYASDIYLLGAVLYEIFTGSPPHAGTSMDDCLRNVCLNRIRPTSKTDELVSIALKAMATRPETRYASVEELQDAIRQYQSHSQSIFLSTRAEEHLKEAEERGDYDLYARALLGFEEAYQLWNGNSAAKEGIARTSLTYAVRALSKENFDLAASLLDESNVEHVALLRRIRAAQQEQRTRQQRLKTARRVGAALVLSLLVVISVAFFWIRTERDHAAAERDNAVVAEQKAVAAKEKETRARQQAEDAERRAKEERRAAVKAKEREEEERISAVKAKEQETEARKNAQKAESRAVRAQENEEYSAYIAQIGLAAARIEENAFTVAKSLLTVDRYARFRDWEWGRLMYLCTQSRDVAGKSVSERFDAVAFSPDGKHFVTGGLRGAAHLWGADAQKMPLAIDTGQRAFNVISAAFSPDGNYVALGTNDAPAYLKIYNVRDGKIFWEYTSGQKDKKWHGHRDAILSLVYSHDGKQLLSTSYDATARLWDTENHEELKVFGGHDWWVRAAAFSPDDKWIVTASQDGTAIVWNVADGTTSYATFRGHTGPVYAVASCPADFREPLVRGDKPNPPHWRVATGGYDKRVVLWESDKVQEFNFNLLAKFGNSNLSRSDRENAAVYKILEGHTAAINSLQFSADGRLLASGSNDNTVRVWDVGTGKELSVLKGHGGSVQAITFSADSAASNVKLLSAGYDNEVKLWDLNHYEEKRVLAPPVIGRHQDSVLGAAFSPTGEYIVTAGRDRTAILWDYAGRIVREFKEDERIRELKEGHEYLVTTAVFFPDGKRLVTAAADSTARIWDIAGAELLVLKRTGPSAALAMSRDGKRLLTGGDYETAPEESAARTASGQPPPGDSREGTSEGTSRRIWPAKLWNAESGALVHLFNVHRAEVTAVAFSPDNELLLTGDARGNCLLWDAKTYAQIGTATAAHSGRITAAVFLPSGNGLLTASSDNTVALWGLARGLTSVPRLRLPHPDAVLSMDVAPNGVFLATACADKEVRLWDLQRGKEVAGQLAAAKHASSVAFSADGQRLVTTDLYGRVRLWNWSTGQEIAGPYGLKPAFKTEAHRAWSSRFTPDGTRVITAGGSGASLWAVKDRRPTVQFGHQGAVASARFSPDSRHVVTANWDNTARIWNEQTAKVEHKLQGHSASVNEAVFSPDGTKVLTASDDKTAVLWDARTGEKLLELKGHREAVRGAAFSHDGKRVVTASKDKTARVWDANTGKPIRDPGSGKEVLPLAHDQAVLCAAFSPDDAWIITGSEDSCAKRWDAATGAPLPFRREGHTATLDGHTAGVTSLVFSADGKRIVTGSRDGTAKVWELESGRELLTLKGHSQEVTTVAFSPDQKTVITGSLDGTAILWFAVGSQKGRPE
jgi:WD40 repeat protein/serine/threonine protein kinase